MGIFFPSSSIMKYLDNTLYKTKNTNNKTEHYILSFKASWYRLVVPVRMMNFFLTSQMSCSDFVPNLVVMSLSSVIYVDNAVITLVSHFFGMWNTGEKCSILQHKSTNLTNYNPLHKSIVFCHSSPCCDNLDKCIRLWMQIPWSKWAFLTDLTELANSVHVTGLSLQHCPAIIIFYVHQFQLHY